MKARFFDLENKTVLVTGATRGIGRGICRALGEQKAHVVVNYRSDEALALAVKDEIETLGGKATLLKFDVTQNEVMEEALNGFIAANGPITGLVNNAGISKDQIVLRIKKQDVATTLETNLLAPIVLTSFLSRSFLKAENVSVVNIGSVVGLMGNPSQIAYASAKAGLVGLTKSYAKELASRNIRCNLVCPGFIETDMTDALNEKAKEFYMESIPLKRFGKTDEISSVVCFLLSQASSYITGEIIKVDGGIYT